MTAAVTTWGTAVAEAAEVLSGAGIEEAALDARLLLCSLVERTRTELLLEAARPLAPDVAARYAALVARRCRREPLAYILGRQEFMGLPFTVDPRALVPRWDTEVLVERLLAALADRPGPLTLADVGTGSGVIAVSLAVHRPDSTVWATDVDPEALELAAENAARLGVAGRVRLLPGHLAAPLLAKGLAGRCDGVIANLPYVPTADLARLEPEVRCFEPARALDGGPDGLALLRSFVPQADRLPRLGGLVVVEHGDGQVEAVERLFEPTRLVLRERLRDLGGRHRGLLLEAGA